MCGIAGVVSADAARGASVLAPLGAMRDALWHRGPDDSGQWLAPPRPPGSRSLWTGLAHRRLSILDLSPLGRQPMGNEDGTVQTVFNGEITNYPELRAQLVAAGHCFSSHTDTEVLVHGYEEWGQGLTARLQGMFAFAIYDARHAKLLLARDRFGIKPLFYARRGATLLFASELKSLLVHPLLANRQLDHSALYDYLTHLYIPAPKTAWQGIHKFPPAHQAFVGVTELDEGGAEGGELTATRYWDIAFDTNQTGVEAAAEQFESGLTAALRSHLMSDVPLGVFLSGGLDSGSVVATLRRKLQLTTQTFTAGFEGVAASECAAARQVACHFETSHHETTVALGGPDAALKLVNELYDEPFGDGSAVPTSAICEFARRSVTVALAGDGGDETLAGYNWYTNYLKIEAREARLGALPGLGALRGAAPSAWKLHGAGRRVLLEPIEHYAHLNGAWTRPFKQRLLAPEFAAQFANYDDYWNYRRHWRAELPTVSRLQYLDMHTYLPDDILTKVDRAGMKHGLEVRVPFLDAEFAQTCAAWPLGCRHDGSKGKIALRRALSGILPDAVLQGRKRGFSAPWRQWLTPEMVAGRLEHGALAERGWLAPRAIMWARRGHIAGGKAWALLVLNHWLESN